MVTEFIVRTLRLPFHFECIELLFGDIDAFRMSLLLLFFVKKRITSAIVNSLNFVLAAVVCTCFSFASLMLFLLLYHDGDGDFLFLPFIILCCRGD
jgi:hypothetical protein